jgi:REP element-mobilizing transposase RayT
VCCEVAFTRPIRQSPGMPHGAPGPNDPHFDRARFEMRSEGAKEEQLEQNPLRSGIHSRGYLPHVKREGASYFITFRLVDSMPHEVLMTFERERAEAIKKHTTRRGPPEEREEINREFLRKVERFLDKGVGGCHLRKPEIATLVANALKHFDRERYEMREWAIMPNHVHVIVWPMPNHLLSEILKSWKTFTSREANKILGRTGETFWQRESFDHWIRDDDEKARIARYIRNNPVIAGLCAAPQEWRWSSAWAGREGK